MGLGLLFYIFWGFRYLPSTPRVQGFRASCLGFRTLITLQLGENGTGVYYGPAGFSV